MKQSEILKIVQEVGGNQFDFDEWYAECWSVKKGGISYKLANNLIRHLKENKKIISSVLDVCSGSGEFISCIRNICTDCMGIDTASGFINYASRKCSDVKFKKVDSLSSFKLKKKFDLISCNGDVVNMFTREEEWNTFFKTIAAHLNVGGMFLFDFYTLSALLNMQGVSYEEGEDLDYISKRTQNNGLVVMSEVYYLKESSIYYRKTSDVMVETSFELDKIIELLKANKFKNIKVVDSSLTELKPEEMTDLEKLHIICEK